MRKKIFRRALYVFFFLLTFGFFLLWGMDGEVFRPTVESVFREKTGYELSFNTLKLSLPFSASLSDVKITDPAEKEEVRLDMLETRIVYWKLLILRPTVRFSVRHKDGMLTADIGAGFIPGRLMVDVVSHKFPLDKAIVKYDGAPLPLSANADLNVKMIVPLQAASDLDGTASVKLSGLSMSGRSVWVTMLQSFVPQTAKCAVEIKNRNLATKDCGIVTSMGNMDLRLSSKLGEPVKASPLAGSLVFNPSSKLADTLGLLYGKYRKPDGLFYFPVGGTLSSPNVNI